MKNIYILLFGLLSVSFVNAQQEFHVFPNGKSSGNGSLSSPWDLQTAFSQKPDVVNGGDTIWLHEGVYTGRFVSTIKSTRPNQFITVAPYNNGKVVLNGNIKSSSNGVLEVKGGQVIFRDFEVTWLGTFSRDESDKDFQACPGISHTSGENCKFINLQIYNNPGLGFGSWKHTGGSIIEDCMIYFNGYMAKTGKGAGEGMYVQNQSESTRIIRNNIIYNNYYKGIEVWSAGKRKELEFVKNITLKNNVIFNSGALSGNSRDNLIIATDDRNGINIAKNIKVIDNIFYHNTDFLKNEINGDAASLTLGFRKSAPVEDVLVQNNVIIGRNNALRLLHVKSATFKDNKVYSGYVALNPEEMTYISNWNFDNNHFFTKREKAYRIDNNTLYTLKEWQNLYKIDTDSKWSPIKEFDLDPVLSVTQSSQQTNRFTVVLFDKKGKDVAVDFSKYDLTKWDGYKIYDAENSNEIVVSGVLGSEQVVEFPMDLKVFQKPLHNTIAQKTPANFGVFIIEFQSEETSDKTQSLFNRIFGWLGF
ncbi:right-handed parallel beta-helix repeat-containing protein [Gelidibacter gilvus]|uniref:Right-handed parallel beta-helix repeat-containing protein n=1 Tax=Gelidibacter gilvus TaxID=59602 RepID=A0A4Q0XDW1_9FLAO|nr:right-handed parallel beta-helix repeat-containing protein [Gelidibacter gilvus]RXJ49384.1 hypothetical protein ESZ48_12255 [Gelidibacter gilvus]